MPRRPKLEKKGKNRVRDADSRQERDDYLKGIAALERHEPTITLGELERRLNLNQ